MPDDVFEAADDLAEKLGVSRSHLYSQAMAEYLAAHRDQSVTERLNAVYAEQPGALDPVLEQLQAQSLPPGEW